MEACATVPQPLGSWGREPLATVAWEGVQVP